MVLDGIFILLGVTIVFFLIAAGIVVYTARRILQVAFPK